MATKKLSEALAQLQKAVSVSGLDTRLVVAGNTDTENAKTITLQQLLTALNVPTVQTGVIGNNKQFVYSVSSDNPHAVMSGTFKAFQFNGKCHIRHKFWGSTNDYTDGQWTTCEIPAVNTSSNGVFEAAMLARLRNTTLTEVNSTTDKVVVNYPNYANGSTKTLEITKATTAKAGVMTAEQVKQLQDLVNNPTSGAAQYLKWDSANHKYTYVATETESDAVIPIASGTKDGLMSKENAKSLSEIQQSYKDLGNFSSEGAALDKIKSLEVCSDSNIVHAHLTYANGSGKNTITLIQSIDNTMCRQIIFNKMKAFHRTITFTDASRTAISTQEDWMFLFGDRLAWSPSQNKYVLSQFGNNYGWDYTDPIPTATLDNDGLMSKEQVESLEIVGYFKAKQTKKQKYKCPEYEPCVHKPIPLLPKKGRKYFFADGQVRIKIKRTDIVSKGLEFTYKEDVFGSLLRIQMCGSKDTVVGFNITNDLTKYKTINAENFDTLFPYNVNGVCFIFEGTGYNTISIFSDEEQVFSDNFGCQQYNTNNSDTSSVNFKIVDNVARYCKNTKNIKFFNTYNSIHYKCKNFISYYRKKRISLRNGVKISTKSPVWKKVSFYGHGNGIIEKYITNNQSRLFRLYPCVYKFGRKKYKSIYFTTILVIKKLNKIKVIE